MLLQALLKRLNGGSDTASTRVSSQHRRSSPLVYGKYPILPNLLLKLIRYPGTGGASASQTQKIFTALEILERFGVPEVNGEEIWQSLMEYRANPVWSIREKAARTIGMIIKLIDSDEHVRNLIATGHTMSQNEIHGNLMTLRTLFTRTMATDANATKGKTWLESLIIRQPLTIWLKPRLTALWVCLSSLLTDMPQLDIGQSLLQLLCTLSPTH